MSEQQGSYESQVETTSVFRAELLKDMEQSAPAPAAASQASAIPAGAGLLVVKRGPNSGARFLLDQEVTSVGRSPESDIFLDDVTVSRRHAEFRMADGEFRVCDLGSLNGTYVNREPKDEQTVHDGDEIQIGKFRLVFVAGRSA
ncbi:FHA domain-containing protein [Corynebacterium choanae]|uniref:Oxoglutarate dehydrogenase inhibitor n=1 Tax=Corynebacterium choanae TaxID=1862358 RepID=A0A3G6J5Z1_9CORY|nr:FHA domain-containing protein [Corynebacterium choanae]AZA13505.1 Oxoglutarate dehydrogenase inhibitor [Corynebacterium choanae]